MCFSLSLKWFANLTHCFSLILCLILGRDSRGKIMAESSLVSCDGNNTQWIPANWQLICPWIMELLRHMSLTTAWWCQTSWWLHYSFCTRPGTLHPERPHRTETQADYHCSLCLFRYDKIWDMNCSLMTLEASRFVTITSWGSFSSFRLSPRLLPLPELTH